MNPQVGNLKGFVAPDTFIFLVVLIIEPKASALSYVPIHFYFLRQDLSCQVLWAGFPFGLFLSQSL